MCSLLLSKRKDKYRSVSSKTRWEIKHYHQQNQEHLKFQGQLILSRTLFHFTGKCAYEIIILDLLIFIFSMKTATTFPCRRKEIQKCDMLLNKSFYNLHIIFQFKFLTIVSFMSYSARVELRNSRRTLFTFDHTALLFWKHILEKMTCWLFGARIGCSLFGFPR